MRKSIICRLHSELEVQLYCECRSQDMLPIDLYLKKAFHARGGSRIFERGGGGVQAQIQDFSQAPPPWTLSAWRHPPFRKIEKHPHSWTSQAPPPWALPMWRHPHYKGVEVITPVTHTHPGSATGVHLRSTNKRGGGSNFGPNVKKPTSWPKGGGGGPDPWTPPPGSATACT